MENPGNFSSIEYPYDDYYYNYEYNYTYEDSMNYLPLDELIPSLTFYVLIGLLGLAGNTLVIVAILAFPRMKSITNVFLLSLASADLLLVLICVPIKLTAFFSYTWRIGPFLCTCVAYIQNVSMVCSVLTLTVMSIERFVAIIYPLQARSFCTMKHAKFVTIFIWIGSFIIASPTAFVQKLKEVGNSQRKAHWCVKQFMSHEFEIAYEVYMFFILFAIPLGVMLVTYIRISIEIWDVVSKRAVLRSGSEYNYSSSQSQSNGGMARESSLVNQSSTKSKTVPNACSEDAKTRKQVILMLMMIVLLFAICWGPILLNNLLVAAKVISDLHEGFLKPMRMAFHLMSYANSCVNPIVYGIMSKNFQDSLKSVLKCCNSRQTYRTYVYSTDTTRASILKSSNSEDKDNGCIEMN